MKSLPVHGVREQVQIGARLRTARLRRRYTLDQVAGLSGMTKGFLSRVERDLTSPSVSSLVTLCQVLQIEVGSLFEPPAMTLVRAAEAPDVESTHDGVREQLLTGTQRHDLQALRVEMDQGSHGGDELYSLDCELEVWHVVSGEVEVTLNDGAYYLGTGDTMTFAGREPHSWRNVHEGISVVIVVLLPLAAAPR